MKLFGAIELSALWEQIHRSETVFERELCFVVVKALERCLGMSHTEMDQEEYHAFVGTLIDLEGQCAVTPSVTTLPFVVWSAPSVWNWTPYLNLLNVHSPIAGYTAGRCGSQTISALFSQDSYVKPVPTSTEAAQGLECLCRLIASIWHKIPCPQWPECFST